MRAQIQCPRCQEVHVVSGHRPWSAHMRALQMWLERHMRGHEVPAPVVVEVR